jgi:hypothetical protein
MTAPGLSFFILTTLCLIFCSPAQGALPYTLHPDSADFATDQNLAVSEAKNSTHTRLSRAQKAWALNLGATGAVMAWGIINWDYFSRAPTTENEKWFGLETKSGGADKLGHLWTGYALSHGFTSAYTEFGYPEAKAQLYGSLSSLAVTGLMEVGDSFSDEHGFSAEDMAANMLGAGIGWLLLRYPHWNERLDMRWEYAPEFNDLEGDITTDYEHSKYLLALKAEGFDCIKNRYLKCLELHLGYYTRGYAEHQDSGLDKRRRYVYVGAGVNVGRLVRDLWDTPVFDYIQVPYTYAEVRSSLE